MFFLLLGDEWSVEHTTKTALDGGCGCMDGKEEVKLCVTGYWFMKIFLTSLSSLFLWQHHAAGESVSAPIRSVTTVGDQVRASQIIKNSVLAQGYWLLLYTISWAAGEIRKPRPQSFTRDLVSFAQGFAVVKPSSVVVNVNVYKAQTRATWFGKICTTINTK